MSNVEDASPVLRSPDTSTAEPETVWRLIAVAIGWQVLAIIPAMLITIAAISWLISIGADISDPRTRGTRDLATPMAVLCFNIVLLRSIFVRGRIVGHGDVGAGIGDGPVYNLPIMAALCILVVIYSVLLNVGIYEGYFELSGPSRPANPWLRAYSILFAIVIAPLIEELFFRGWLWTGLQRRCGMLGTALLTSALFIAIHFPMTLVTVAALVPTTILYSMARHIGRSVRAPIALHAIRNLTSLVSWTVMELYWP